MGNGRLSISGESGPDVQILVLCLIRKAPKIQTWQGKVGWILTHVFQDLAIHPSSQPRDFHFPPVMQFPKSFEFGSMDPDEASTEGILTVHLCKDSEMLKCLKNDLGLLRESVGQEYFFSWLVAQSPLATSHCRCQNLNENLVGQLHGRNGSQDHQPLKISRVLAQSMICRICMYHVVLILKHILHPVVALVARRTLPRISCHWNDDMIKMEWFS